MQMTTPVVSLIALLISITQEKTLGMITKDYVTLAFVLTIDNVFSDILPEGLKQNAEELNEAGTLKMGTDFNSMDKIKKRLMKSYKAEKLTFSLLLEEIGNILVNIIYISVTNFAVIFYNYFAPMTCIFMQLIGFYYQERNHK